MIVQNINVDRQVGPCPVLYYLAWYCIYDIRLKKSQEFFRHCCIRPRDNNRRWPGVLQSQPMVPRHPPPDPPEHIPPSSQPTLTPQRRPARGPLCCPGDALRNPKAAGEKTPWLQVTRGLRTTPIGLHPATLGAAGAAAVGPGTGRAVRRCPPLAPRRSTGQTCSAGRHSCALSRCAGDG